MESFANPTVLALLLALIAGLFLYSILMPRNVDSFKPKVDPEGNNPLLRATAVLGNELYISLPRGMTISQKANPRIESLLVRAGNPWNMKANEFVFFQYVTAFIGLVVGGAVGWLIGGIIGVPWWGIAIVGALFGFMTPRLRYRDQAKKRDLDFKRQLPEALDLIIISLTGGATFVQAIRDSIPNMQPGVLKEEFKEILAGVDTGKTLDETLNNFGERAPNESIKTFVQAVREASELDVPLADVLKARADASRQEFFALIHNKTAALSSKMMAILTPTLIPALLIIVLTPAVYALMGSL